MDLPGADATHEGSPVLSLPEVRLTGEQIDLLRGYGEVRPTVAGEVLFREGDRSYDFIVILAGRVAIVDHQAGTERELASGGPGEFVAELNLLTGERLFTTAVVTEPGAVLAVPGSPGCPVTARRGWSTWTPAITSPLAA